MDIFFWGEKTREYVVAYRMMMMLMTAGKWIEIRRRRMSIQANRGLADAVPLDQTLAILLGWIPQQQQQKIRKKFSSLSLYV
jgi:hypothetical protein